MLSREALIVKYSENKDVHYRLNFRPRGNTHSNLIPSQIILALFLLLVHFTLYTYQSARGWLAAYFRGTLQCLNSSLNATSSLNLMEVEVYLNSLF